MKMHRQSRRRAWLLRIGKTGLVLSFAAAVAAQRPVSPPPQPLRIEQSLDLCVNTLRQSLETIHQYEDIFFYMSLCLFFVTFLLIIKR